MKNGFLRKTLCLLCAVAMLCTTIVVGTVGVSADGTTTKHVVYTNNNYNAASKTWLTEQSGGTAVLESAGGATPAATFISQTPDNPGNMTDSVAKGDDPAFSIWDNSIDVYYDLGTVKPVDRIDIVQSSNQPYNAPISSINVYVSNDASSWGDAVATVNPPAIDRTDLVDGAWAHQYIPVTFAETMGRYVRVAVAIGSSQVLINNIGICGPAADVPMENMVNYTNNNYSSGSQAWLTTNSDGKAVFRKEGSTAVVATGISGLPSGQEGRLTDGDVASINPIYGVYGASVDLYFDLGASKTVNDVDIALSSNNDDTKAISSISVFVSDDTSNWGSAAAVINPPAFDRTDVTSGTWLHKYVNIAVPETTGRYVRLLFSRSSPQVMVNEIAVCGPVRTEVDAKYNSLLTNAAMFIAMDSFSEESKAPVAAAYNKYKNTLAAGCTAKELAYAIDELQTAIDGLVVNAPVILSGNNYSGSYKTWIQSQDATAPVDLSGTTASVVTELCSGVDSAVTPYTRANDGEKGSGYHLQGAWDGGLTVITYDLGETQFISRVDICNSPDTGSARNLGNIKIEASSDGSVWATVKEFTAPEFTEYEAPPPQEYKWGYQLVTSDLPLTEARYVRVSAARGNSCTRISEIAISGLENPVSALGNLLTKIENEYLPYKDAYTEDTFTALATDYVNAKADFDGITIAAADAYVVALKADIAALVVDEVLLSGVLPNGDARKWLDENGGEKIPAKAGKNPHIVSGTLQDNVENINNGALGTSMSWGNYPANPTYTYDFGGKNIISRIDYVQHANGGDSNKINSLTVETSLNGTDYTTVATKSDIPEMTAGTDQLISIEIPLTVARYVKITAVRGKQQVLCSEIFVSGVELYPSAVKSAMDRASYYLGSDVVDKFTSSSIEALNDAYVDAAAYFADESVWAKDSTKTYANAVNNAIKGLVSNGYVVLSGNNVAPARAAQLYGVWNEFYPTVTAANTPSYTRDMTIGSGYEGGDPNCTLLNSGYVGGNDCWVKWGSSAPITTVWDLGDTCTVAAVDVAYNDDKGGGFGAYAMGAIKVEVSNDNAIWTTVGEATATNDMNKAVYTDGKNVCMDKVTFTPVDARYVRISTSKSGVYQQRLQQIVIYGWVDDYKTADILAINTEVGDDTSDNVLKEAELAIANINEATTKTASAQARDTGIANIQVAKQANIDANFQVIRGAESGLVDVPTVQALKDYNGSNTAIMRFVWQLLYDTEIPITSIGSYTFNWDSFDKGATNAIVLKKNPEIESGWTFDADLTDIPDYGESIRSIPMVNGIIFADSIITSTVDSAAIN